MANKTSASIVLYNSEPGLCGKAIQSLLTNSLITRLYLLDNSPSQSTKPLVVDNRVEYIFNQRNLGFGAAHNIALTRSITENYKYHLVMNPDVYFENGTIENICEFMDCNTDIGLLMPKVLYPDGSTQYLCKLLPLPLQLILRRFLPFKGFLDKMNEAYELRFTGYDKIMDVPYLSGCFMFIRTKVLEKVGLFDERFFMYFEDLDITRRINLCSRTIFYPESVIYHNYEKGSYKSLKLLMHHLASAIRYFNKWGYIFDESRHEINEKALRKLGWYKDENTTN